jgi:aspartyl-tRNA(Asn)/glutamyl-tRNA(Gln) amidotransferase subunit A
MRLFPSEDETITGTGKRLRQGETTCLDVLRTCLDRIEQKEPAVRAWVLVDRDGAERQARALDDELKSGRDRGPLHGIPIGIKDIIDVQGLPTANGLAGRRWLRPPVPALHDAPVVAQLRAAGAIILGKTVSTPFAYLDPPVTRNPWNFDRTPGGSSSGSAAAVASGMCLGAIGTQTGGSITRPAAFCGVAGMKPTYGQVSTIGVLPLAPSLDHVGPIARSVADLRILYEVMLDPDRWVRAQKGAQDQRSDELQQVERKPSFCLARLGSFFDERSSHEMRHNLDAALYWLEGCGAQLRRDHNWPYVHFLLENHGVVVAAEAAATHGPFKRLRERYFVPEVQDWAFPDRFLELLEQGASISACDYIIVLRARREPVLCAPRESKPGELFPPGVDALVTPAAVGPAPEPSTTGDPSFNSPWSLLGLPTISFPIAVAADGLPLAVQLIGRAGSDLDLLKTAEWCERAISSAITIVRIPSP